MSCSRIFWSDPLAPLNFAMLSYYWRYIFFSILLVHHNFAFATISFPGQFLMYNLILTSSLSFEVTFSVPFIIYHILYWEKYHLQSMIDERDPMSPSGPHKIWLILPHSHILVNLFGHTIKTIGTLKMHKCQVKCRSEMGFTHAVFLHIIFIFLHIFRNKHTFWKSESDLKELLQTF